jgi:hypothetical protein
VLTEALDGYKLKIYGNAIEAAWGTVPLQVTYSTYALLTLYSHSSDGA